METNKKKLTKKNPDREISNVPYAFLVSNINMQYTLVTELFFKMKKQVRDRVCSQLHNT